MRRLTRISLSLALVACVFPAFAAAQEPAATDDAGNVVETIKVERADAKEPKHANLRFLKDNRVFIRAQLDLLRTQVTRERDGNAQLLDERYLRLKEMSDAIAAARDSVHVEEMRTAQRELLASITQLGGLETELATMEALLADQRHRLLLLEEDFLGHQETALVILIKGLPGHDAPASLELSEENEIVRVELTPEERASLEQGGIAQIYHEFVEPREHVFAVTFAGDAWATMEPVQVTVEAARDRLTFLELDLGRLDHARPGSGLLATIWYR